MFHSTSSTVQGREPKPIQFPVNFLNVEDIFFLNLHLQWTNVPSVIPMHAATTETAFAWRDGWVMAKRVLLKMREVSIDLFALTYARTNV